MCNPVNRFLPPDDSPFYAYLQEDSSEEEEEEEEEGEGEEYEVDIKKMIEGEAAAGGDVLGEEEEEEVLDEYMFTRAEYDKLKYESPLIKQLRRCQVKLISFIYFDVMI